MSDQIAGVASVSETALAFCMDLLRTGLTIDSGASFDVKSVVDEMPNLADVKAGMLPAAFVWGGSEDYAFDDYLTRQRVNLGMNVIVLRTVTEKVERIGRRMIGDVVKLLAGAATGMTRRVTHETGDFNLRITPLGSVAWNGLVSRQAGGHLVVDLQFYTQRGNIFQVA